MPHIHPWFKVDAGQKHSYGGICLPRKHWKLRAKPLSHRRIMTSGWLGSMCCPWVCCVTLRPPSITSWLLVEDGDNCWLYLRRINQLFLTSLIIINSPRVFKSSILCPFVSLRFSGAIPEGQKEGGRTHRFPWALRTRGHSRRDQTHLAKKGS